MNAILMLMGVSPVLSLVVITVLALLAIGPFVLGAVLIQERQVGVVVKRFGTRALPPGRVVALGGEAGYQADTLAPGLHFGYWRWQYRIIKVSVTVVSQGEIALVLAADGAAIPPERILGRALEGWFRLQPRRGANHPCRRPRCAEGGRLGQALASCFGVALSSRRNSSTRYSTAAASNVCGSLAVKMPRQMPSSRLAQ